MANGDTKAVAEQPRHRIAVGSRGLIIETVEDLQRLAGAMVRAGIAPRGDTAEVAFGKMVFGMELGLSPVQSLSSVVFVHGTPSLYGTAFRGVILSCPSLEKAPEEWFEGEPYEDNYTGYCKLTRKGMGEFVGKFSVADAKRAGLWGKDNYKLYPDDMLPARAFSRAARRGFGDVLKGCYPWEELREGVQVIERDGMEDENGFPALKEVLPPSEAPTEEPPPFEDEKGEIRGEPEADETPEPEEVPFDDEQVEKSEHDQVWDEWKMLEKDLSAEQKRQLRKTYIDKGYIVYGLDTDVLASIVEAAKEMLIGATE